MEIEALLISKVRIAILKYFFLHQESEIHLREIVRETKEELNAVRRELNRMTSIKLLESARRGNRLYFKLNRKFILFLEIESIVYKILGPGSELVRKLNALTEVFKLFIASKDLSTVNAGDIDILLVGSPDLEKLEKLVKSFSDRFKREINIWVISETEYKEKLTKRDLKLLEFLANAELEI